MQFYIAFYLVLTFIRKVLEELRVVSSSKKQKEFFLIIFYFLFGLQEGKKKKLVLWGTWF